MALFLTYLGNLEPVPKQDTPMEIVFTEPKQKNTFISASDAPQKQKIKPKKEVEFKSNRTNRTDLETYQRPKRKTEIQASISSGGQNGRAKKQKEFKEKTDDGTFEVTAKRIPLILPGFGSTSSRPTIPAYVQQRLPPGVRLGNITSLNTDQHRYYSFNQRLLSRFVPLWGNKVRHALYQWLRENNAPVISKTWVTNVEVIMNKEGEILDVQPFRLSGLWSIDEASINSFKTVKNVPNPPEEMVDENGYIHMQFQTEVLWIPQPGVRFHGGDREN